MKCPKCQGENSAQAKFCVHCGFRLGMTTQENVGGMCPGAVCAQCGAALPAGVKFCTSCGTPVGNAPVGGAPVQQAWLGEDEGTVILNEPGMEPEDDGEGTMILEDDAEGTMILEEQGASFMSGPLNHAAMTGGTAYNSAGYNNAGIGQSDETTMLQDKMPYSQNGYGNGYPGGGSAPGGSVQPGSAPQKSGGSGGKVVIALLCVLIAAAAVVLVLVWRGIIELPFELPFLTSGTETETAADTSDGQEDAEGQSDTVQSAEADGQSGADQAAGVLEEQLADADAVLQAGKGKIEDLEHLMDGMDDIRSALDQYKALTQEYGVSGAVSERAEDAYDAYVSAVVRRKNMMAEQDLSGGIYTEVMKDFDQAAACAEELADAGLTVDTSLLASEQNDFDTSYRSRVIKTFNEFAFRDSWSRTEAWNLMDDMDAVFSSGDLDDPLRLRYCYALAWWTQRQCETDLNGGIITQKGAATKIAGLIEATDYNPMLIDYYIQYMHAENQDCSEVERAYNDIVDRLEQTQGIRIGQDVDLAHFWYFNDFGEYSVDDKNGVTAENRQWIRERMRSVTF